MTGKSPDGAWYQFDYDGAKGWVNAGLVSASGDMAAISVVATIPPPPTAIPQPTQPPTPTPTPAATAGAAQAGGAVATAPELRSPAPDYNTSGIATFTWSWSGPPLTANQAFEVRMWKEDRQDHLGAAGLTRQTSTNFNVQGTAGVKQGGAGVYFWTVAVVEVQPYKRVGPEAPRAGSSSHGRAIRVDVPAVEALHGRP